MTCNAYFSKERLSGRDEAEASCETGGLLKSSVFAARLMVENKATYLPAVEDEKLVGVVTETDLLEALLEILSEK